MNHEARATEAIMTGRAVWLRLLGGEARVGSVYEAYDGVDYEVLTVGEAVRPERVSFEQRVRYRCCCVAVRGRTTIQEPWKIP